MTKKTKTAYQFDDRGYYIGEAQIGELENGALLMPPNSVKTAPPQQKENCKLRWVGEWVNEPIPPEFVPEPEPTLDELKNQKKIEIENSRWQDETGGCDWLRKLDNTVYRLDTTDRGCLKVSNARQIAEEQGEAYVPQLWKTETGWFKATLQDLTEMGHAIGAHVQKCFDREAELVALIEKATTQEELDEIVWTKVNDMRLKKA